MAVNERLAGIPDMPMSGIALAVSMKVLPFCGLPMVWSERETQRFAVTCSCTTATRGESQFDTCECVELQFA